MSRITNDVSTIQQAISFALVQVFSGVLLLVWIAWNMLSLNWAYALLSLAVVPLMAIATVWFSGQARKAFPARANEIGNVNAELEESISGVREVQAFSREDANIRVSAAATPPTATPTCAPLPTPRLWRPRWKRWAMWPSPSSPASAACFMLRADVGRLR
jgi:ABC-type multidrug transport system fused ATPase/permease subunit